MPCWTKKFPHCLDKRFFNAYNQIIISKNEKGQEKKEYIPGGTFRERQMVEKPQQRRMEAVFSVFREGTGSAVEKKSILRRKSALTVLSDGHKVVTRVVPRSIRPCSSEQGFFYGSSPFATKSG